MVVNRSSCDVHRRTRHVYIRVWHAVPRRRVQIILVIWTSQGRGGWRSLPFWRWGHRMQFSDSGWCGGTWSCTDGTQRCAQLLSRQCLTRTPCPRRDSLHGGCRNNAPGRLARLAGLSWNGVTFEMARHVHSCITLRTSVRGSVLSGLTMALWPRDYSGKPDYNVAIS